MRHAKIFLKFCDMCMRVCRPREGHIPWTGGATGYELPCGYWELKSGLLEEQQMLLYLSPLFNLQTSCRFLREILMYLKYKLEVLFLIHCAFLKSWLIPCETEILK